MDDFKGLGGRCIEISGGEPLCHKKLPQIIKYAKKLGLEVSLFSCGIFHPRLLGHNHNLFRTKVKELKKLRVDRVFVTLHGSYEELHNSITKRNSFRQSVRFIKTLVEEKIPVGVHFVPVHGNFDNIDDLETFCRLLGVQQIGILRFVPQGRGKQNEQRLRLSKEQTLELTSLLAKKKSKSSIFRVGRHLDFTFFFQQKHAIDHCPAGISKCTVTAKGLALPCPVYKGLRQFVAGDVHHTSLRKSGSIHKCSADSELLIRNNCEEHVLIAVSDLSVAEDAPLKDSTVTETCTWVLIHIAQERLCERKSSDSIVVSVI